MLCKQQVSLRSNVHLCVNCIASPVLNFHWQPSEGWQDYHSVRHIKKKNTQKNNNIDRERHRETTGTNTQTNTHCLGAAGRPGSQHSAGQSQSCSRKWLPLLHHLCMGSSPCKAGAGREHTELGCYVTYCFHVTRKAGSMFQLTWTLFECKGNESCSVSF